MTSIKIKWGSAGEQTKTYHFETEEQKAFFMKGVDEAEGWLKYEVLEEKDINMFKIYDKKEPTYDEAREFIKGYIQSVPLENGDRMLCDEEGKLKRLNVNKEAQKHWVESYGETDIMVGPCILVKAKVNKGW